ncbi:MAG: threonine ammonia-lyase, partial [Thermodesulfobacteriota bacterium]
MLPLIKDARKAIAGVVKPTPVVYSASLGKLYNKEVYLKLENLQKTGSFKPRGAYNKIRSLSEDEKKRGVITASSGNHAQGVAWAAALLGVNSVIVMPETTPIVKYMATRGYGGEGGEGGEVVFHGSSFDEAFGHAEGLAREEGRIFIHPFDDELIMAGQGTIGLEIVEAVPEVDTVVVPVGGGGLISGIATAVKETKKGVKIIGVEVEGSASCIRSLKEGRPVGELKEGPTIADGIAIKKVGEKTFPVIKKYVDDVVSVSEETIAAAILKLLERKKLITEGAGAVALAAAMEEKLPASAKKVVLVLSGGNIDVTTLDRVIRLGLLREGRIRRFSTVVGDLPGSLARLTSAIAEMKGNIVHIVHQRDAVDVPVGEARVEVIIEVE